jgi:hypothetical protein
MAIQYPAAGSAAMLLQLTHRRLGRARRITVDDDHLAVVGKLSGDALKRPKQRLGASHGDNDDREAGRIIPGCQLTDPPWSNPDRPPNAVPSHRAEFAGSRAT